MQKTFLIIGHTGFIGKNLLKLINENHPQSQIIGISKNKLDTNQFTNLTIKEFASMQDYSEEKENIDYVFFLAHGQDSEKPSEEEKKLTQSFIELIQRNKIESPIILILSAGSGSEHLNSRIYFNEQVKSKLNNRVIEIKTSVIASPGSISYEIPYRCVKKLRIIPAFPWYDSKVSLAKIEDILTIFEKIIEGSTENLYYPPNYTTTYGEYIKKIAKENEKQVSFLKIPFNEFFITPIIVSWIIGLPYYLIRNLMKSLAVSSVIKES